MGTGFFRCFSSAGDFGVRARGTQVVQHSLIKRLVLQHRAAAQHQRGMLKRGIERHVECLPGVDLQLRSEDRRKVSSRRSLILTCAGKNPDQSASRLDRRDLRDVFKRRRSVPMSIRKRDPQLQAILSASVLSRGLLRVRDSAA